MTTNTKPRHVEVNGLSYTLFRDHELHTWFLLGRHSDITDDELTALHLLAGQGASCSDDQCPCYLAGFNTAAEPRS